MGGYTFFTGQTLPLLPVALTEPSGAASDLTGATLALLITNLQTGAVVTGAGAWVITNPPTGGQATYEWAASDTAIVGRYAFTIEATYPSGATEYWGPTYLTVRSLSAPQG